MIIGRATRNDIVNDAWADAIFATLKAIVDDETSTTSSTISLRVAWPYELMLLFVWNTLTVSQTVSITIPLRRDPQWNMS